MRHKHGHSLPPSAEYIAWCNMLARCCNKNRPGFEKWGGRGITVCERWNSFENFLADLGPKPGPKYTLERIDNAQGYFPGNVRWAAWTEQNSNRRNNRFVTIGKQTLTAAQWAHEVGISRSMMHQRLKLPTKRLLAELERDAWRQWRRQILGGK